MKNQIVTEKSMSRDDFSKDDLLVILNGKTIKKKEDFLVEIEKAFRFPAGCENSINIFLDWITDLWWISENSINLVIYNQRYFLNEDSELKKKLMKYFEEDILPFWEHDVLNCMVGGECKKFMVYLVDEQL